MLCCWTTRFFCPMPQDICLSRSPRTPDCPIHARARPRLPATQSMHLLPPRHVGGAEMPNDIFQNSPAPVCVARAAVLHRTSCGCPTPSIDRIASCPFSHSLALRMRCKTLLLPDVLRRWSSDHFLTLCDGSPELMGASGGGPDPPMAPGCSPASEMSPSPSPSPPRRRSRPSPPEHLPSPEHRPAFPFPPPPSTLRDNLCRGSVSCRMQKPAPPLPA